MIGLVLAELERPKDAPPPRDPWRELARSCREALRRLAHHRSPTAR